MKNKLLLLFLTFLKIGSVTFGGGMAMLPMIKREAVEKHHWIKESEIVDIFAVSQSLPGVIAVNACVFIGKKVAGIKGAFAAALAVSLPAFLSIIIIVSFFSYINENLLLQKAFVGIIAASAALITVTAFQLGKNCIKSLGEIAITVASFITIIVFGVNAMWVIIASIFTGLILWVLKLCKRDTVRRQKE